MRILLVSDTSGYMRGGVPAETRALVNGLLARGHRVALCGDVPVPGAEGAEHFPISLPVDARLAGNVQAAMTAFRPNVVHVVAMNSRGIVMLGEVLASTAWVMTSHSIPPHERKLAALHGSETLHYGVRALRFAPNAAAWWWLLRRGTVPRAIVHSEWMRTVIGRYGQRADRIKLIPLGCEIDFDAPFNGLDWSREAGPRLVTTGGLAHTKGQHDALRAVALLRERFPGLRYQIIGEVRDDSYVRFLHALIGQLDLSACVRITPNLPEAEKVQALAAADLYLQPSHEEGFCLAFIEAALSVPRLVGTDTGAIRRISEDDAGTRVVPPRWPAAIAAAATTLLTEPLPQQLGAERRRRLHARFGWDGYLDAHEHLYRSLHAPRP